MSAEVKPLFENPPRGRERPRRRALDELIDRVAEDARRAPERYLEDAKVPAGGE